jgi:UDP-glucose 4-epimerase
MRAATPEDQVRPMRILVTGGAGFIGSNLVHALVSAGHVAFVIDDLSTGSVANVHPSAHFRTLDILDPTVGDVMAEFAPDAVVHLAAQTDVQRSIVDPARDRAVNVNGTAAVARAAAAAGARKVLSASSAAVYGDPEVLPLTETAAKRAANPYGVSKLDAEMALARALEGTGIDFASMRFSNVYGPRQDWRGEGGVVAILGSRFASGQTPVVFGDGRQTRDFIYVGDVVAFILEALETSSPLAGEMPDGPAYNVSTGVATSVEQVASYLRALSLVPLAVEHQPAREGDIVHSVLDPAKATRTLGWQARQPIEDGLAITWRWLAANLR